MEAGEPEPEPGEAGGGQAAGGMVGETVQVPVVTGQERGVPLPWREAAPEIPPCVQEIRQLPGVTAHIGAGGVPEGEAFLWRQGVHEPVDTAEDGKKLQPAGAVLVPV
jgi:hypothetical protein